MSATAPTAGSTRSAATVSQIVQERRPKRGFSLGALVIGFLQAGCAIIVSVNRISVALGFGTAIVARDASFHNNALIRFPMLGVAALLAGFNMYVVYRGWRIRRNPAAAWRIKPLSRRGRLRIAWVLISGVLTFALIAGELATHNGMHPVGHPASSTRAN